MAKEPRSSKGCWLKLSKSGAVQKTITKQAAIDAALRTAVVESRLHLAGVAAGLPKELAPRAAAEVSAFSLAIHGFAFSLNPGTRIHSD